MLLILMLLSAIIPVQQEAGILIRVKNDSPYDLKNVKVASNGSNETEYGSIRAGQYSEYKKYTSAYRTAAITAEIDDQKVQFLPDDYLGEQHLNSGKYTFSISVIEAHGRKHLRLKFLTDET